GPSRCDESQRRAMLRWERLAIHLIGEDAVVERLRHFDAAMKRRDLARRIIRSEHVKMMCGVFNSRRLENVAQAHAGPLRVPHRAITPLHARESWLLKCSSVSGTLQDACRFGTRHLLQFSERE